MDAYLEYQNKKKAEENLEEEKKEQIIDLKENSERKSETEEMKMNGN